VAEGHLARGAGGALTPQHPESLLARDNVTPKPRAQRAGPAQPPSANSKHGAREGA
jgi:hypothetical protein